MIVDEYTNMLDPTCGSGSALRAAEALGASRMLGLEWNESFAADATKRTPGGQEAAAGACANED